MSAQANTILVIDTSTNTIVKRITHPDLVRPANGKFHPNKQRFYAGGVGKVTVWDTTDLANPVYLKTITPSPGSTGEYRGVHVYKASPAATDGDVYWSNIHDAKIYIYRAADIEGENPTPEGAEMMRELDQWPRRQFLLKAAGAGVAGAVGFRPPRAFAEPPPETTKIRLSHIPSICLAPQYAAEELLRGEGFTEVHYIGTGASRDPMDDVGPYQALAAGKVDLNGGMIGELIARVDPIVILGGIHAGCFELFGSDQVRSVRDLKGKTVAVPSLGTSHHYFVASIAAYVGLDPGKDVAFVAPPLEDAVKLFVAGKIDAIFEFPPVSLELRAKRIGHVVIDGRVDRPWSQYFCCMLAANREFVRRHPAATKRAVRAILKANNICALEPGRVARILVDRGHTTQYDYAVQASKELPYARWRDYDAADTVRFYALRLREARMLKATPQKTLADGTDWRFLNELKRELRA